MTIYVTVKNEDATRSVEAQYTDAERQWGMSGPAVLKPNESLTFVLHPTQQLHLKEIEA